MPIRWLTIFLDFPAGVIRSGVAFWSDVTGSTLSAWRGTAGEFATLVPRHGDPYIRVQRVDEGSGGCHLDLHLDLDAESLDEASARAATLGARARRRLDDLVVLESPGGFTFCLVPWEQESTVPGPVQLDSGGASRVDQLCLDIPSARFEAECDFWERLTGWELRAGALPEFAFLVRPGGIPVRLLFQHRRNAGKHDKVRAHVDFACADAARLAVRHAAAGARALATFPLWLTMADPTGHAYCLTKRDPETGRLPDAVGAEYPIRPGQRPW